MTEAKFEGQQAGERILYEIHPHIYSKYVTFAKLGTLCLLFYAITYMISTVVPSVGAMLQTGGLILAIALAAFGFWWIERVYKRSVTFLTDRRIMRIDVVSPFFETKRALFWHEALKAKGHAPNLLYRFLNIGTLEVLPQMADHEDVRVTDVYYFEDIANYIDKILYTYKQNAAGVDALKPFAPKPRGQRD